MHSIHSRGQRWFFFKLRISFIRRMALILAMLGAAAGAQADALACSAAAAPEFGTPPLTVHFTASASGGAAPYTFAWDFGDAAFGSGAALSHIYTAIGTYTWTLTVTDQVAAVCTNIGVISVSSVVTHSVFLASAARASGAAGTNWKTDVMMLNTGTAAIQYVIYYTPAGMDGTSTPYVYEGTIPPAGAPLLTNIVETLFGLAESAGSVRIVSNGPLKVSSRTYNDTGSGTYGQWVPGQTLSDAIAPPARAFLSAELIGVVENADFRSNIGFSEIGGQAALVLVNVFDGQNNPLESNFEVTLPPYGWVQLPLSAFGVSSGDNLRVQLVNQGPGTVLGYASVVDNATGDAVFIPARRDDDVAGDTHQLVAITARIAGDFGTDWSADLYLYNPLSTDQYVTLQFIAPQGVFNASLTLAANEVRAVHDAVSSLFPEAGTHTAGSLQILSDQGLILVSRIYNQTSAGTYGQFVPAFDPDEPVSVGVPADLLMVIQNGDYRTNIGFSEFFGIATTVSAILYDSEGNTIAITSSPMQVPAGGNIQIGLSALFNLASPLDSGRVRIQVTGGGAVYPYVSVVDDRTGDAVFVPGIP